MKIETRVEDIIQLSVEKELYDYEALEKIIELVDEFAIDFAEWMSKYKFLTNKGWYVTTYHIEMDIFKTSKELLEIYKKENGL